MSAAALPLNSCLAGAAGNTRNPQRHVSDNDCAIAPTVCEESASLGYRQRRNVARRLIIGLEQRPIGHPPEANSVVGSRGQEGLAVRGKTDRSNPSIMSAQMMSDRCIPPV